MNTKIPEQQRKMMRKILGDKWNEKMQNIINQNKAALLIQKLSYTKQIEDLHETIGLMSESIITLCRF